MITLYESADAATRQVGEHWYLEAHAALQALADQTSHSIETAVGVTAALSPFLSWDTNLQATERMLNGDARLGFGHNRAKAQAIIAGAPPLEVLSGPKVLAFYDDILHPDRPELVVVDRHVARAWAGLLDQRGQFGVSRRMYERIASDIKLAADELRIWFHHFQATVWLMARKGV